jgi:hypothetical protein
MMGRGKWVVPAFAVVAAAVAALAGYQGAASQQTVPSAPAASTAPDTVITHDPGPGPWGYHGASSPQGYSPVQPIKFPHPKHVKGLGMNCLYCHYAANRSPDPGMPAMSTCMGCHLFAYALAKKPEIVKLTAYWNQQKPIPWVRIHRLPEYVHFPHMRHVNAGVTCQTCHGQIQEMYQVYQYSSLNMGWCVNCHVNGYTAAQGDEAAGSARAYGPAGASSQPNLGPTVAATTPGATATRPAAAVHDSIGPPLTDVPHRARYDCSTCHY